MMQFEDYSTLEELEQFFSKKISLLNECLDLKCSNKQELINFFRNFESSLIELRSLFFEIKNEITQGQAQVAEMKGFLRNIETLNGRLDHMQQNYPAVLKQPVPAALRIEKKEVPATPVASKQVKVPAKIPYLTLAEFESVPKYMKGRLNYTQINSFIDSFNKVITAKYKLLSMPRKSMKPAEYKMANAMKLQENSETKGSYFCTSDNLRDYGNVKMDKASSNFIAILRHCTRLKEVRGPGPLVRYVIIS